MGRGYSKIFNRLPGLTPKSDPHAKTLEAKENLVKFAAKISKKLGISSTASLHECGNMGCVFDVGSSEVFLKLTTDEKEVKIAHKIKNKDLDHFITIYETKIVEETPEAKYKYYDKNATNYLYAIVVEKIRPLNKHEKKCYSHMNRLFFRTIADERVRSFIEEPKIPEDCQDFWLNLLEQRQGILREMNMIEAKRDDFHRGNVGFDVEGNFIVFDVRGVGNLNDLEMIMVD